MERGVADRERDWGQAQGLLRKNFTTSGKVESVSASEDSKAGARGQESVGRDGEAGGKEAWIRQLTLLC